jgi:hypothetical protein
MKEDMTTHIEGNANPNAENKTTIPTKMFDILSFPETSPYRTLVYRTLCAVNKPYFAINKNELFIAECWLGSELGNDASVITGYSLKEKNDFDLANISDEEEAKLSNLITKTIQYMLDEGHVK